MNYITSENAKLCHYSALTRNSTICRVKESTSTNTEYKLYKKNGKLFANDNFCSTFVISQ